jgi:multidrug transporter EmrE-like cation transporter
MHQHDREYIAMPAWVYILAAGMFETAWPSFLDTKDPWSPVKFAAFFGIPTFWLLIKATEILPNLTTYLIFIGFGAIGNAIVAMALSDRIEVQRVLAIVVVIAGVLWLLSLPDVPRPALTLSKLLAWVKGK